MTDKRHWYYRWEPGRIIGLSRVCLSSRGLFHLLFDIAFQRGVQFPSTLEEAAEMSCSAASSIARAWGGLQGIRCEAEIYLAELLQATSNRSKVNSVNGSKRNSANCSVSPSESVESVLALEYKEAPKETLDAISPDTKRILAERVKEMCDHWPKVNTKGEALSKPSQSQTRAILTELMKKGKTLDGLCRSAAEYLRDFRDNKRPNLKAPQFYFSKKGYWEDNYSE